MIEMTLPIFVEDSNPVNLAPKLSKLLEKLKDDADKSDFVMAFLIAVMSESSYRVLELFDPETRRWSNESTCIPSNWKLADKNVYEIQFLHYIYNNVRLKLIGAPTGDWLILNLLSTSECKKCKSRSMIVNTSKYVNMHQKELNKYWNLKELSIRFKNTLLVPIHGEVMAEINYAVPTLLGMPEEVVEVIFAKLSKDSLENLSKTCRQLSRKISNWRRKKNRPKH